MHTGPDFKSAPARTGTIARLAPPDREFSHVGERIRRIEGHAKVTGQARYSADIRLPGQLYARVLRSPYPHARIRHIDTSTAEQLSGVHAVISNVNAPSIGWYQENQLFWPLTTLRFAGDEVAAVTARIAPHMIQGHGARAANPADQSVRTFGVQCAEVEVDIGTGEITLLRLVAAHDCGRIINPLMLESQVIGGITQGIGFALCEQRTVDGASGLVLNANLEDYKIPSVADIPPITHAAVNCAVHPSDLATGHALLKIT